METIVVLTIPADHAAFAGHFPGNPIVPGVVLLDESLHSIATALAAPVAQCTIVAAKFLSAAHPGESLQLHFEHGDQQRVSFTIHAADRRIATGVVSIPTLAVRPSAG
jgi:3-hydroxymyristoyl/3-hydroxydecanoyl-(acyl carrier protein) dehydratase